MNLVAAFVLAENDNYQVVPWRHIDWLANRLKRFGAARVVVELLGRWVGRVAKCLRVGFSILAYRVGAPGEIFESGTRLLKHDHLFATISVVSIVYMYGFIYWLFKPTGLSKSLEELPRPASSLLCSFLLSGSFQLCGPGSAVTGWLFTWRSVFCLACLGSRPVPVIRFTRTMLPESKIGHL